MSLAASPCPICGRPADPKMTPFCSSRCADVDLQRWLSDRYVIASEDDEIVDPEAPSQAGQREDGTL